MCGGDDWSRRLPETTHEATGRGNWTGLRSLGRDPVGCGRAVWPAARHPGCMRTDLPICLTCGVQYGQPREDCPICLDERQYVGYGGQQWTTLAALAEAGHRGSIQDEGPGITGIGAEPAPRSASAPCSFGPARETCCGT